MLGYAGTNHTLRDRDPPLRCNRSMRQATFQRRGLEYVADLPAWLADRSDVMIEAGGKEDAVRRAQATLDDAPSA